MQVHGWSFQGYAVSRGASSSTFWWVYSFFPKNAALQRLCTNLIAAACVPRASTSQQACPCRSSCRVCPYLQPPQANSPCKPLRHTLEIQAMMWAMLSKAMPASVGLLMPAAAIVGSLMWGDEKLLLATCLVPYLGTLLCQIWMEGHFTKRGESTCSSERSL